MTAQAALVLPLLVCLLSAMAAGLGPRSML